MQSAKKAKPAGQAVKPADEAEPGDEAQRWKSAGQSMKPADNVEPGDEAQRWKRASQAEKPALEQAERSKKQGLGDSPRRLWEE
ncbi:MAG: hypothetical protein Q9159_001213 [Coniocarpon cinnabarinum]